MPQTYDIGDTGVNELYADMIYERSVHGSFWTHPELWGKPNSGKPLCYHNDFKVKAGRRISCRMTGVLNGPGFSVRASLDGKASQIGLEEFQFTVDGIKSPPLELEDDIDQQAVEWDLVEQYRDATADWFTRIRNAGPAMHLAGATFTTAPASTSWRPDGELISASVAGADYHQYTWTSLNATSVPTTQVFPNESTGRDTAEELTSADILSVAMIEKMKLKAQLRNQAPMLKCRMFGQWAYLLVITPQGLAQMKTADTQYDVVQRAIIQGGGSPEFYRDSKPQPWNECFILVTNWMPPGQNSTTAAVVANTRKCLLLGANAYVEGHGKGYEKRRMRWVPQQINNTGVRFVAKTNWGGAKVVWTDASSNTRDNGVIVGCHYVEEYN